MPTRPAIAPLLWIVPPVLVLGLAAARAQEKEEIHACPGPGGSVVYQDDPCPRAPVPPSPPKPRPPRAEARSVPRPPASWPTPEPREPTALPDPRLGTPERAWTTFVTAMRDGDRATALSCLASPARERLGPAIESAPVERLRETVDALGGVERGGPIGPFWSLRVPRGRARPTWILLERTASGDWKISGI